MQHFLLQMYHVVIVENWSSVIPTCWLDEENGECRWPPKKTQSAIAILKRTKPAEDWKTLRYKKLLGSFGKLKNVQMYNTI